MYDDIYATVNYPVKQYVKGDFYRYSGDSVNIRGIQISSDNKFHRMNDQGKELIPGQHWDCYIGCVENNVSFQLIVE